MPNPFTADPDSLLDYSVDWSQWLADGETIASYNITVESGITLSSDSENDGVVTVWLTGGTAGRRYDVTCQITTSEGRIDERSFVLKVVDR